ncbi:hypothetical protein ACFQ88_17225 [Paenibacillus sp. NPDC056579]|uniref:hypothetical protein n=1 Tax=Paenibacillus sp. NPDC056579 TaxID=3345871 RepID=UPI0036ABFE5D
MITQITRLKEPLRDKGDEISQLKEQFQLTSSTPTENTVNEDYKTLCKSFNEQDKLAIPNLFIWLKRV